VKVQIFKLHGTEADGNAIPAASIYGPAAFASARTGFALGRYPAGSFSFYPVQTANAGRRWRIIGPSLSEAAADGAIAVSEVGVAGPKTYFAWEGGGNGAIDVTADSGKVWRRVLFDGTVVSATPQLGEHGLDGLIQVLVSSGPACAAQGRCRLDSYSSRGGIRWRRSSG
jgi:hypothetical protein